MYEKLVELITYPYFIFQRILEATGLVGLFLGAIAIVLVYRFLIKPLTGGRFNVSSGSDSVVDNYEERTSTELTVR